MVAISFGGVQPSLAQPTPRLLRPEGGVAAPNARLDAAVALFLARGGAGPTAVGARPPPVSLAAAVAPAAHGGGFVFAHEGRVADDGVGEP